MSTHKSADWELTPAGASPNAHVIVGTGWLETSPGLREVGFPTVIGLVDRARSSSALLLLHDNWCYGDLREVGFPTITGEVD